MSHPGHEIEVSVGEYSLQDIEKDNAETEKVQHISLLADEHVVNDVLYEPRRGDCGDRGQRHTDNGVDEPFFIGDAVF